MAQQIGLGGSIRRIHVIGGQGELEIESWDEQTVGIEGTDVSPEVQEQGETLIVRPDVGNLHLRVPTAMEALVEDQRGALQVRGIASLTANRADGDVHIEGMSGTVVLRDLDGNLHVRDAESLTLEDGPRRWTEDGRERGVFDARIEDVRVVTIANIRHDLELRAAQNATVGNIGHSCTIEHIAEDLQVKNIGGSCTISDVSGSLYLDNIGGSATLSRVGTVKALGNIGGSLTLAAAPLQSFSPAHPIHVAIGGSARLELPAQANVIVDATVGGSVQARGVDKRGPGMHRLVYGDGTAHLHLIVGGSVELVGDVPQVSGATWEGWVNIGKEIGRAVGDAFGKHSPRPPRHAAQPPFAPSQPATGPTTRMDRVKAARHDSEEEREAILQMVAEGRLSPADGDVMLDALGS